MKTWSPTFVEAVLAGDAKLSDVDDWVDAWHNAPPSEVRSLDHFLGLNAAEGATWAEFPDSMATIVHCRKFGRRIVTVTS